MKRVFISVVVAGVAALGILPATSAARSAAPSATSTTTGPAIRVNPLSQQASHCAQPSPGYLNCFVVLKNTRATGVSWWMASQWWTSGNGAEHSTLYANGQVGQWVDGYLNPGQSVTVEINTEDCYFGYGSYWSWIVGSASFTTTFGMQATVLSCYS